VIGEDSNGNKTALAAYSNLLGTWSSTKGDYSTSFLHPACGDSVVLWAVRTDKETFIEGKEKRRFPLLSHAPAWMLLHLLTSMGKMDALTLQLQQSQRETSVSGEVYLLVEKKAGRRQMKG